jgi:acetylornithine deacetylase
VNPYDTCQALLQSMVRFDTVNSAISGKPDAELELALQMEEQADAMGLETLRLPVTGNGFNLLVSRTVSVAAPWLLFESHLDTVSVEGMTVPPFDAVIRDGRMYGRGTCDTKGTGAAMLWALGKYKEEGLSSNNVAVLFTLDEEVSKTGVRTFVTDQLPDLGWRPGGVIVGEPTRLALVGAHNGVVRWRIVTEGVAAHSSDPSKGRSAISMMTQVIETIEREYVPSVTAEHPLTGKAQCSINIIHGGVQINIIPENCEIHIDRRVVPGESTDDVLPVVEKVLDRLRKQDPNMRVSQERPDMVDSPLDPAVGKGFAQVVGGALGRLGMPNDVNGVGYGTDASTFGQAGIPAVVLGPGDIAQGHTADEWIDLAELARGVDVYFEIMCSEMGESS